MNHWVNAAHDYAGAPELTLPPHVLGAAIEGRRLRIQPPPAEVEPPAAERFVAESEPMRRLVREVGRVAPKDVTVLLRGETGTGKELVASLLHARSRRAAGPLVRVNCAAIPAELAEAELFGHSRGAFTGAMQARRGFFAEADGGTLVLDEIGELPLALQPKLLRVLQEGEIQPVGSGRVERVDVRVIASTNRDLEEEVRSGGFREDLYYRLAVVELVVPSLRKRRDDVPALATEFARRYAARFGMDEVSLSPALLSKLRGCEWPGNVRQLENAVARMVALGSGGEIGPDAFAAPRPRPAPPAGEGEAGAREAGDATRATLAERLDAVERTIIVATLAATRGNRSEAARRLGVGRTTLIDRLKKHGIT